MHHKHDSWFFDDIITNISSLGSYEFFMIVIFFFAALQNYTSALFLLAGFIVIQLIVFPLRLLFFRERPMKRKYTNLIEKIRASSMPSMHAALISFLLQSLLFYVNGLLIPSIFFVALTILVLYSRTHLKYHHTSDVVVGFLIGLFVYVALLMTQIQFL